MAGVKDLGQTWFPGQMARTRRLIRENLGLVGLVIEVADSRAPRATRYPGLEKLVPGRPILTVLGKADLADPDQTARWVKTLREGGRAGDSAASFSSAEARDAREVQRLAVAMALRRTAQPGVRAMVVGLPNVGKSTLINRLAGRAAARTGDRPGITRGKQWLKAGEQLLLLDLPGILVPGRLPGRVALTLALLGILPREAFDPTEVALHALDVLEAAGRLPPELAAPEGTEVLNLAGPEGATRAAGAPPEGPEGKDERLANLLVRYAVNRGHLRAGGEPDIERAAVALVVAFREGRFGRITLEDPAIQARPDRPGRGS